MALLSKVGVLADDYSDTYTTLKQQMARLHIRREAQWRRDTVARGGRGERRLSASECVPEGPVLLKAPIDRVSK